MFKKISKPASQTHQLPLNNNPFIQPRLNVGKPGDKYEVEADNAADKIVANGKTQSNGTSFFMPSIVQTLPNYELNKQNEDIEIQEEQLEGTLNEQGQELSGMENPQGNCLNCEEDEQIQVKSEKHAEVQSISGTIQFSSDLDIQTSGLTDSVTEMECSDGRNINDNGDHDLDKLVHQPDDRSPDIWFYDNLGGESGAYSDFYIGFFAGTFGVDTSDDNRLFNNFTGGSGSQINFTTGSDMAREIGGTTAFTNFAVAFEESVRNYYNTNNTLQGFDCQAELIRTRPDYVGGTDSLFSWAVMGGYQRLEAHIDLSAGQIDITYRVFDHYGAGVSDAWSYLPGLSAMYYLQHYVTGSSSTYVPFIWSVRINRLNTL